MRSRREILSSARSTVEILAAAAATRAKRTEEMWWRRRLPFLLLQLRERLQLRWALRGVEPLLLDCNATCDGAKVDDDECLQRVIEQP